MPWRVAQASPERVRRTLMTVSATKWCGAAYVIWTVTMSPGRGASSSSAAEKWTSRLSGARPDRRRV
jgi:hypothetical protein